ncbi:hypothetical protein F511_26455 [Dorcoceras hygrometricum]|uniref:Uncharacterized protein n=1 Tax=Dorcoceras hygrometricum TaxID=472368 RepID=A0A2Z7CTP9_9LAMI|nr:hypothetical protein F511_26455 [Dorcoceras hygrometricum]
MHQLSVDRATTCARLPANQQLKAGHRAKQRPNSPAEMRDKRAYNRARLCVRAKRGAPRKRRRPAAIQEFFCAWLQPESQGDWLFTVGGGRLRLISKAGGGGGVVERGVVSMTFRVVRTNQYNQDLGLVHSTNDNHLESPNEGSSIDHQVTIYLHAQNITMFPTNETWSEQLWEVMCSVADANWSLSWIQLRDVLGALS